MTEFSILGELSL